MNTLRVLVLLFLALFLFALSQYDGRFGKGSVKKEVAPAAAGPEKTVTPVYTPPAEETISLKPFTYPNGTTTQTSVDSRTIISTDDPEVVAGWYVQRMQDAGLSSKTNVKSTVNDNTQYILAGAGSFGSIRVEVVREKNDFDTTIRVMTITP